MLVVAGSGVERRVGREEREGGLNLRPKDDNDSNSQMR